MNFKNLSVYGLIYVILIAAFFSLLIISATLPHTTRLNRNMRHSAKDLLRAGDWPMICGVMIDYYTDSLILNVGYTFQSNRPVSSSVAACYSYIPDEIPGNSGANHLHCLVNNPKAEMKLYPYWRYWFGHSAVMKILHYAVHLERIYMFQGIVTLFLLFLCCLQLLEIDGRIQAFALFVLLSLCNMHAFFMCLQYYPVFWIGLIGLIVLNQKDHISLRRPVFFALGMLTAYFDLLTAPILAFGIPGLFICCRDAGKEEVAGNLDWKTWFWIWCGYPAAWLAGYILSWGTKILLGILNGSNLNIIVKQIMLRSGNTFRDRQITGLDALRKNFNTIIDGSSLFFMAVIVIFGILLVKRLIAWKYGKVYFSWKILLGCLLMMILPVMVILIMPNHTFQHAYMTYWGISMTIAGLLVSLTAFHRPGSNASS